RRRRAAREDGGAPSFFKQVGRNLTGLRPFLSIPDDRVADAMSAAVFDALANEGIDLQKMTPERFAHEHRDDLRVHLGRPNITPPGSQMKPPGWNPEVLWLDPELDGGQMSHVSFLGAFDEQMGLDFARRGPGARFVTSELRVPLHFLFRDDLTGTQAGTCWVYHINFDVTRARLDGRVDNAFAMTLAKGYYGVTGRPFRQRMDEHVESFRAGEGHLLHSVWRQLHASDIDYTVQLSPVLTFETEDEAYLFEERVVESSLAPRGLNMIPGGRGGIRFLSKLGVPCEDREEVDGALEIAIASRSSITPHYRSAHVREYRPGKFTLVSGCWVRPRDIAGLTPSF
ncbi:hypothetical protein, partial [Tranquillimonas alkanivorans]